MTLLFSVADPCGLAIAGLDCSNSGKSLVDGSCFFSRLHSDQATLRNLSLHLAPPSQQMAPTLENRGPTQQPSGLHVCLCTLHVAGETVCSGLVKHSPQRLVRRELRPALTASTELRISSTHDQTRHKHWRNLDSVQHSWVNNKPGENRLDGG